jgi:hypothetical protein
MNYLIRYKSFNESFKYISDSINWELIQTAKDLALEYLDEGFRLRYSVNWHHHKLNVSDPLLVLTGAFSHDEDSMRILVKDELFKNGHLKYPVWLTIANSSEPSDYWSQHDKIKKYEKELISRIEELYPGSQYD